MEHIYNDNNITYLDGKRLYRALIYGINKVISRQDHLNKINVFPVPDSDTGTNLAFTLSSVIDGTSNNLHTSVGSMFTIIADSALDGARGNSGAILAQFFQGMSDGSEGIDKMTTKEFSVALESGSKYAREALSDPKEGTILTVLNDFSNHIVKDVESGENDFINLFESGIIIAKKSLDNTPNQLNILKKSGVVDAGAQGFVDLLTGIQEYILNGDIKKIHVKNVVSFSDNSGIDVQEDMIDMSYRYCTECIIKGDSINRNNLREDLLDFGNSLVLAGSKNKAKVHIHVNKPNDVFDICKNYGNVIDQKADDMFKQQKSAHTNHKKIAVVTDSGADIPNELMEQYDIHIVPVRYNFGDQGYIDKISHTTKEFYNELNSNIKHPQTSQPTPGDFRRQYQFITSHYDSVISIHLPRALSGTLQSAEKGSKKLKLRLLILLMFLEGWD